MPNDDDPQKLYPSQNPLTVSDDFTAQSLASLTAATLSPDHPAAQLRAMNDKMHALLHSEGDQTRLLMRQSQTLDALFHLLIQHGIASDSPAFELLALSLRSQKLCRDTVHTVNAIDYMHAVSTAIGEKIAMPPSSVIARSKATRQSEKDRFASARDDEQNKVMSNFTEDPPPPFNIDTNELKDRENES